MGKEVYLAKKKGRFFYFAQENEDKKDFRYAISNFKNIGIIPFEEFGVMVPSGEVVRRARNIGARVIAQDLDKEDNSYICLNVRIRKVQEELEKMARPYIPGTVLLAD